VNGQKTAGVTERGRRKDEVIHSKDPATGKLENDDLHIGQNWGKKTRRKAAKGIQEEGRSLLISPEKN